MVETIWHRYSEKAYTMNPKTPKEAARQGVLDFYKDLKAKWIVGARKVALYHAKLFGEVCADDLHRIYPIPPNIDPRIMASAFKGLTWKRFKKSERKECHHRIISVFTK